MYYTYPSTEISSIVFFRKLLNCIAYRKFFTYVFVSQLIDSGWLNQTKHYQEGTNSLAERVKKEIALLTQTRSIIADNLLRQKMLAICPTGLLALFKKINIWYLKQRLGYSSSCQRVKTKEREEDKGENREEEGPRIAAKKCRGRGSVSLSPA